MPSPVAYVALDDDPTGAQSLQDVRVLLDWRRRRDGGNGTLGDLTFMLTNTRSMDAAEARHTTSDAARVATSRSSEARFLLRSDSTLRGHLLDEYLGLCDVVHAGRRPALLLVPALPAAGRITLGGVHYLERDGHREAVSETVYARDPIFGYRSSHLLDWAEERSQGFFRAARGQTLSLEDLRSSGAALVARRLNELAQAEVPGVLAPDVVTAADLELIAEGLRRADAAGVETVVRCGPAFVAALAGHAASDHVPVPQTHKGLLVVCGSWVPTTTRQLHRLQSRFPGITTQIDLGALRDDGRAAECARASSEVRTHLDARGLAIVSTPREHAAWASDVPAARLVRSSLMDVVSAVADYADIMLTKGGITSADVAVEALAEPEALVVGPVEDGVMHWRFPHTGVGVRDQLVVPGNVGDDDVLTRLVDKVLGLAGA
jgi:uncharacterized protein YgbK (DUF1537 family)